MRSYGCTGWAAHTAPPPAPPAPMGPALLNKEQLALATCFYYLAGLSQVSNFNYF